MHLRFLCGTAALLFALPTPGRAEPPVGRRPPPRPFSLLVQAPGTPLSVSLPAGAYAPPGPAEADGATVVLLPAGKEAGIWPGTNASPTGLLLQLDDKSRLVVPAAQAVAPTAPDLALVGLGGEAFTWRFGSRPPEGPPVRDSRVRAHRSHAVVAGSSAPVRLRFPRGTTFRPPLGATMDPLPRTATLPAGGLLALPSSRLAPAAAGDARVQGWLRGFAAREQLPHFFEEPSGAVSK